MSMIIAAIFWLLFHMMPTAAAAEVSPAISVTPSLIQIDLRKESSDTLLYYKNISETPVDLILRVKDFNGLEEEGKVNFLDEKDAKNYQYSLSSWISFDNPNVSLSPGEEHIVHVHIDKEKLPVGGHYAAILAQFVQRDVTGKIPLDGVLSSLVFVRAGKGYEREEAHLPSVGQDAPFLSFPSNIFFRFQNTGNVDVTPYGLVTVTDIFGRTIARGIVNQGSLIALPESIRRFDVSIQKTVLFLFPSLYHVHISLHFGESDKKLTSDFSFFSQGTIDFVKIILALLVLWLMVWVYRSLKKPFKD